MFSLYFYRNLFRIIFLLNGPTLFFFPHKNLDPKERFADFPFKYLGILPIEKVEVMGYFIADGLGDWDKVYLLVEGVHNEAQHQNKSH